MAPRLQWFDTLRLSISQKHGKGWSVRERNPVRPRPAHLDLGSPHPQQLGDEFAGWAERTLESLRSRLGAVHIAPGVYGDTFTVTRLR
jgi:hypothetical protein